METNKPNGATPPPAAPSAAAKRVEIPSGPISGRKGEAILEQAITNALLNPAAADSTGTAPKPEGPDGATPSPTATPPGGEGAEPAKTTLPPGPSAEELAGALNAMPAEERSALDERAKANGVTPEDQLAAESQELARLEAKAKELGVTPEEVAAQEEQAAAEAAGAAKQFSQKDVEELIQKRVKNLAAENETLKRQLAERERPVAPNVGNGPLDGVTDGIELGRIEADAHETVDDANQLLESLPTDPEYVQRRLRQLLGAKAAEADLTPEGMREILRNARDQSRAILKAAPQRRAYLEMAGRAEKAVAEKAPWLQDTSEARTVLFRQLEQLYPQFKAAPTWKYLLAAGVDRLLEWQKAKPAAPVQTSRPAGSKFVPKVTFPKTAARGGNPAPKPAANGQRVAELKAALAKDPTNTSLMDQLLDAQMGRN
ncbi:MAG: hypothetical protein KGL39_34095 [Patescibacteria group bacterium]|nr:hypothetical protein [Patescibacteria group bacterium]